MEAKKIFVVDVDQEYREALIFLLNNYFFVETKKLKIVWVKSFQEATEQFKKAETEVIVLWHLPKQEEILQIIEANQDLWLNLIICGDDKIVNLCDIYEIAAISHTRAVNLYTELKARLN